MGKIDLPFDIDPRAMLKAVEKSACEKSLAFFVKQAWHVVEPTTPYVHNWHIDFICAHLEAISRGEQINGLAYNRLLINIPPGMMKSLLVSVLWPSWIWGPFGKPSTRILCCSHKLEGVALRDNVKMRRVVMSDWYQSHWGGVVIMSDDQNAKTKFENTATGVREAVPAGSITGGRGDVVIFDDPLSVDDARSEVIREERKDWFLESLPSRVNNPQTSAIVGVMQRLHEEDTSGIILEHKGTGVEGWDHIMLPMRYDPSRAAPTLLGYEDPRTEEGELLFPAFMPERILDIRERTMGPFAVAGQHQQMPVPRGGGLIADEWWTLWKEDQYPPIDFVLAVVDTAYTEKQENDPSGIVILGVFTEASKATVTNTLNRYGTKQQVERVYAEGAPNIMLMYAKKGRWEFPQLCKEVVKICRDQKVDRLIIENKSAGPSVAQELRRTFGIEDFGIQLIDVKGDKTQRLYSVQHIFADGMVWAPDRTWADEVIRECGTFPKGKHDEYPDCMAHGLRWLRDAGMLTRAPERLYEIEESKRYHGAPPGPLYPG